MTTTTPDRPNSVFAALQRKTWTNRYATTLNVADITGGIPSSPKVIEGWIKSKLTDDSDELLQERIAEAVVDRGLDRDAAIDLIAEESINGFRSDEHGLFIGGYQVKAMLKEAVNIAVAGGHLPSRNWGKTNKGSTSFTAEHLMVAEDRCYLMRDGEHVTKADEVVTRFAHTRQGTGIVREEVCYGVDVSFTVMTDTADFEKHWPTIWTLAEQQGIGASRSLSRGRFVVTRWEKLK